ncbi:MAG: DUF72 domain-containing protein [candidate division KSB1 bacterium]|nr:DUF72 domain-containing protein [candidate division KSB1 bacterium]
MAVAGKVWIGTSGWNYPHWVGVLYPETLPAAKWLDAYALQFPTVELNNTFYRLPPASVFRGWFRRSPGGFLFAVKANRFITHVKKLSDPQAILEPFVQNVQELGPKLGPVLFQLPPSWKWNRERVSEFLKYLASHPITREWRVAFEIRNPTWDCEEAYELFRAHNVALCFADWPDLNVMGPTTSASFVYIRRHGPAALYSSGYSERQLARDAEKIVVWVSQGMDVYVYFNNDFGGWAVVNAQQLMRILEEIGCPSVVKPTLPGQGELPCATTYHPD